MRETIQKTIDKIIAFASSRYFFIGVIVLFVLQCLWMAFSFRFPMIFDENFHFNVIKIFSNHTLPVIVNQPTSYDEFGNFTFGNASIFHYIMSLFYRFIELFTDNPIVQVIALRIIGITTVAIALVLFAKLFREIGIRPLFINVALLIYVLIPLTTLVSTTISYDNMLLLLTALYLLIGVQIIKSKTAKPLDYLKLIIVGCLATLVKFTFLPIFVVSFIYLAVMVYRRFGSNIVAEFVKLAKNARPAMAIMITLVFVVVAGLFFFRYGVSVIKYGTPIPNCTQSLSLERCMANPVIVMEQQALLTESERSTGTPVEYVRNWFNLNVDGMTLALPVARDLMVVGVFVGLGFLLYAWRGMPKNQSWYFLVIVSVVLALSILLFNMQSYYAANSNLNVQARYLLSVVPIVLVMMIEAVNFALGRRRIIKATILICVLALFTQGGGITTHIIRTENNWYWNSTRVTDFNLRLKHKLEPFIKETIVID